MPRNRSKEYRAWCYMLSRCNNPKASNYKWYGARGITVCGRWLKFQAFLSDMGVAPSSTHSLGRIDNDGNYEPGNCSWQTADEQGRNRRNSRVITFAGKSMCLVDWAAELGIGIGTLFSRLKRGMTVEQALTCPPIPAQLRIGRRWINGIPQNLRGVSETRSGAFRARVATAEKPELNLGTFRSREEALGAVAAYWEGHAEALLRLAAKIEEAE